MRSNIKQTQYILDFSDIEDISDNESVSSSSKNNPPPVTISRSDIKLLEQGEQGVLLQQIKKETVEIPNLIQEDQIPRPKLDNLVQQWEVNFDELSEQDDLEQNNSQHTPQIIQVQKDPSPPVEEPQYIEQYFEDQQIIEEVDLDQQQLKIEKFKEIQKLNLINKQESLLKTQQKLIENLTITTPIKRVFHQEIQICKPKQIIKQKYYNPKNSLIYLRLKGREDLYKKNEILHDESPKSQEVDQLLEGLDCINNLLIDLSSFKEKKQNIGDKNKQISLQIQKHRLEENGQHNKDELIDKSHQETQEIKEKKQQQNFQEVQQLQEQKQKESAQKQIESAQKQKESAQKQKESAQKQKESAQKQQILQEAALAKQIRKEKEQQEKENKKQQEQKQVYKILTKKLINQGMPLYRCLIKQKYRDFIKWLRFSEIALINEGEKEIYRFEKRISDQMFLQVLKKNIKSVTITKQFMFDPITVHYVEQEQENNQEEKQILEKEIISTSNNKQDSEKKINETKILSECKKLKKEKKKQNQIHNKSKKKSDYIQIQDEGIGKEIIVQQQNQVQLNSDDENFDLLDADKIQILKIAIDKPKKYERKNNQKQDHFIEDHKQSDDGVIVKQEIDQQNMQLQKDERSQQICELVYQEIKQKYSELQILENQNKIELKKHRSYKRKEFPLSRLETNDEIKKKEKNQQKRKEKKQQDFLQLLNEIEIEQNKQKQKSDRKLMSKQQNFDQVRQSSYENHKSNEKLKNKQKKEINECFQQIFSKNKSEQRMEKQKISGININKLEINQSQQSSVHRQSSNEQGVISSKRVYEQIKPRRLRRNYTDEDSEESSQRVMERNRTNQKRLKK
ncbi:unnamed protein product [Paramecium sonneborni]|uniref:Uncharacterized protein n=1 Tax=Paramecium sonneborni TaxID=65129 RepID=A0A8S1QKJ8_9CILI|nr:unnamed protein product [Paramecium sonneborni]